MDITLALPYSAWATATAYVVNQYVSNNSKYYICTAAHTSGSSTQPGVGASWASYWSTSEYKRTLTLARESDGAAMWKSYEVAQDAGNQDQPLFTQTDWSGGFGQGNYSDTSRYSLGTTIDTSHTGFMCLAPLVTTSSLASGALYSYPRDMCTFGSIGTFMVDGKYVWKWNTTTSKWDNKATCTGAVGLCVHDDNLFIACGTSNPYYYTADGESYTAVTGYYASGFCSAPPYAGSTPVMWRYTTDNLMSSSEDPTSGTSWASGIYVGDSTAAIGTGLTGQGIFIHQGQLFIGKRDGLYHYDSDGAVHKLLNIDRGAAYTVQDYPFLSIVQLRGATYFTTGRGIGELTSYNSYDQIEPTRFLEDVDITDGAYTGLATDGEYLYASYYSGGSYAYIYKGVETKDADGNSRWAWHPFYVVYGAGFHLLFAPVRSNNVIQRLWISPASETYTMQYMQIPLNPVASASWASDSPAFNTSGFLETGWLDFGHRDWYKVIDSVLVECKASSGDMSTSTYVKVYYATDDSSTYTAIGTTYSTATMGTRKYVSTAPISCKKIKFKIYLATGTSTVTPIVKYFACYGAVRPTRVPKFDFTVLAEDNMGGRAKSIRDFLLNARDTTGLCTLTDRFGASHYVRVLPGYPTEVEYADQATTYGQKQNGTALRVVCEKVDWS